MCANTEFYRLKTAIWGYVPPLAKRFRNPRFAFPVPSVPRGFPPALPVNRSSPHAFWADGYLLHRTLGTIYALKR